MIQINPETLTTAGVSALAKKLNRIAELNEKRAAAVADIEPIESVPTERKRRGPKKVDGRLRKTAPRAKRVTVSVAVPPVANAKPARALHPNVAAKRERKPRVAKEKKARKPRTPRVPKALAQEANVERVIETVTEFLTANPSSNSEAICDGTGLHQPIVKAVIKALGERVTTTGAARGTKYSLVAETAADAGDE